MARVSSRDGITLAEIGGPTGWTSRFNRRQRGGGRATARDGRAVRPAHKGGQTGAGELTQAASAIPRGTSEGRSDRPGEAVRPGETDRESIRMQTRRRSGGCRAAGDTRADQTGMEGRSDRLVPAEEVFGGASGGGSRRAEEYQASGAQARA